MEKNIHVRMFRASDQTQFKAINIEWLTEFGKLEKSDLFFLDYPKKNIIDQGGKIFVLEADSLVIGTACLLPEIRRGVFELGKFAVSKPFRGKGYGKYLFEETLNWAEYNRVRLITLTSYNNLVVAISMYEKYGFISKKIPPDLAHTDIDLYMELRIQD